MSVGFAQGNVANKSKAAHHLMASRIIVQGCDALQVERDKIAEERDALEQRSVGQLGGWGPMMEIDGICFGSEYLGPHFLMKFGCFIALENMVAAGSKGFWLRWNISRRCTESS